MQRENKRDPTPFSFLLSLCTILIASIRTRGRLGLAVFAMYIQNIYLGGQKLLNHAVSCQSSAIMT